MWKIPLFNLNYDDEEKKAVASVLDSGWLTQGPQVQAFESAFAAFIGNSTSACAVSSGTAALHMALLLTDIQPGDEILVSGLTFVADLNVIRLVGAKPVPVDIQSMDDWNISVQDARKRITSKTKAIIAVHYGGWPCDMEGLQELCNEHNLFLIEDAAHAPGAAYKGKKCGSFGDLACFSFFSNKNLATGEGGMLTGKNPDLMERAGKLRSHGMSSLTIDRHEGRTLSYDVLEPGLNYRFDEIRAALGLVQLKKLIPANKKRAERTKLYRSILGNQQGILIPWSKAPDYLESSHHIFPVLLPEGCKRNQIMEALREKGIQTSIHYPAFHSFSAYGQAFSGKTPLADEISERVLTLPLYPTMAEKMVEEVCHTLLRILGEAR